MTFVASPTSAQALNQKQANELADVESETFLPNSITYNKDKKEEKIKFNC